MPPCLIIAENLPRCNSVWVRYNSVQSSRWCSFLSVTSMVAPLRQNQFKCNYLTTLLCHSCIYRKKIYFSLQSIQKEHPVIGAIISRVKNKQGTSRPAYRSIRTCNRYGIATIYPTDVKYMAKSHFVWTNIACIQQHIYLLEE